MTDLNCIGDKQTGELEEANKYDINTIYEVQSGDKHMISSSS